MPCLVCSACDAGGIVVGETVCRGTPSPRSREAAWFSEQYLVWQLLDLCDLQDPFPKPFQLTSGP